jgi:hypothetical protein
MIRPISSVVLSLVAACGVLGMIVLLVRFGSLSESPAYLLWWGFHGWVMSPFLGILLLAFLYRSREVSWVLVLLVAIVVVASLIPYYNAMFFKRSDGTVMLLFLFLPVYQWGGLLASLLLYWVVSAFISRYRRR